VLALSTRYWVSLRRPTDLISFLDTDSRTVTMEPHGKAADVSRHCCGTVGSVYSPTG
jgi:hypothetical protein